MTSFLIRLKPILTTLLKIRFIGLNVPPRNKKIGLRIFPAKKYCALPGWEAFRPHYWQVPVPK